MSLPPIQSPLPEAQKKTQAVTPPERTRAQDDREFKGSMASASEEQRQSSKDRSDRPDKASEGKAASGKETETGKDLPEQDAEVESEIAASSAAQVKAETNTLVLQLGGETLDPAKSDEAVLLAANFVVESLPRTIQGTTTDLQLSSNLNSAKPDILARLQAFTGQGTAPLTPTRQVADSVNLLNLDDTVLKELGKTSALQGSQSTADTVDALTAQANNVDAKTQAAATRTELVVPNRVGSTDWGEAMAGRITLMVNQKISSARIHINPPELGPIEVRVNLNHDQASVQFTSQSAQVRDALEQSIPRLRDMLENAGFSLADSGVNDQSQQGFGQSGGQGDDQSGGTVGGEDAMVEVHTRQAMGLVDDYV